MSLRNSTSAGSLFLISSSTRRNAICFECTIDHFALCSPIENVRVAIYGSGSDRWPLYLPFVNIWQTIFGLNFYGFCTSAYVVRCHGDVRSMPPSSNTSPIYHLKRNVCRRRKHIQKASRQYCTCLAYSVRTPVQPPLSSGAFQDVRRDKKHAGTP